ncbi:MAG: bifunctional alpha,alpha-trehalose-phosphate synthase (UDP-forming)/trehalose-phosphatase [Planctomycetota bacterium]
MVSNRLPTSLRQTGDRLIPFPSSGGLASALTGIQADEGFTWVGWPGCEVPAGQQESVRSQLAEQGLQPVFLSERQERLYYRGLCNEVLWPLFHYCTDRIHFSEDDWATYVDVNRRFAEEVLARVTPGARVWVHDFHLMLVPAMLREAQPDLEIGFFLHIPFPSSEIYRLLPQRTELLEGLLGADYIGFHTNNYVRHFRSSCLRVMALESEPNSISFAGRTIRIGSHPIGVDVTGFAQALRSPRASAYYQELTERYGDRKLLLGVERLDYTKGIPLKLQAFERFLARDPQRAKAVTLLQVLVPSRLNHPEYRELKSEIEETIGRLNGEYGGPGVTPVEYLHRTVPPAQLAALYRFADAALVTPVRDGMNLVAQEFALCQGLEADLPANKGILVLSEFAGAAHYLSRSLLVNPWDTERTADAIETALSLTAKEREDRMESMTKQVIELDCTGWARGFLEHLAEHSRTSHPTPRPPRIGATEHDHLAARFAAAPHRLLALDYDGTLREMASRPHEAVPTPEILQLLQDLAALPNTAVHLISGRAQETMEEWFGDLPIHLCADHGYLAKVPNGEGWTHLSDVDLSWIPMVEQTLLQVAREVPGTSVERKSCALAWHYRMADLDYGVWRARELLSSLEENLANEPVEVMPGHRVIEVRASGINKGNYLRRVVEATPGDAMVLCAGDDRTDLDMYRALPEHAVTIHVGTSVHETTYMIETPAKVRALLRAFCS